ncbi:MAG: hypothetical protein KGL51_02560 [Betaproteobacteria bacterium]|nr:hypothetical protein [Betaproteobacteria bacterium]MDE2123320.1 hypothetical protein [Betaproteobacteria bacterium]MDE2187882.1 hypothetical protein [Betaproteobacteria bacterium]MDE2323540.1 hypothetical protein [Betaproteobacteria bacterium]
MLRLGVIFGAIVFIALGLVGLLWHKPGLDQLLLIGIIVLLAVILERWRYTRQAKPEDGPSDVTDERFVDPGSGKT